MNLRDKLRVIGGTGAGRTGSPGQETRDCRHFAVYRPEEEFPGARGLTRETLGVPVIAIGVPMVVYASVIARDALGLLLQDIGMDGEAHAQAVDTLIEKLARQGLGELVVTPREVDELVGRVGRIIADGLNLAFQPHLSEEEIQLLSHDGP